MAELKKKKVKFEKKEKTENLSFIEKKENYAFLRKSNIPKISAEPIIALLSKKYTKPEIKEILINIIKINELLTPIEQKTFQFKIIRELKKETLYLKQILERIIDPNLKLKQKRELIAILLTELIKK